MKGHRTALALGLAVYAARALSMAISDRDRINPDAVSYIQQATYLAQGDFWKSISGYWSPLFSWCIAPFMVLGMDGLHAAHLVMAAWGAVLVVASFLLIRRLTDLGAPACLAALLLIGDGALRWGEALFPDGIMAACLLACCALLSGPRLLDDRGSLFGAGLCGGVAFLAKAYALPFFLVLLPLTIAWRILSGDGQARIPGGAGTPSPPSLPMRRIFLRALVPGLLGFFLIAGPWMVVLSAKAGRPTFSLVGGINHAIVGPPDIQREHPNMARLWTPPTGRISIWEVPETMTYHYWSPLESLPYLKHQLDLVGSSIGEIQRHMRRYDYLGLSVMLLLLGPLILWRMGRHHAARSALWGLGVATLFASGLTFLFFSYRYTNPFLRPFCLIVVFHTVSHMSRSDSSGPPPGRTLKNASAFMWVVVLLSFAAHANIPFQPFTLEEIDGTPFNNVTVDSSVHRALAAELQETSMTGPLASTLHWGGLYLAYHMQVPYLGTPRYAASPANTASPEDLLGELEEHQARSFLVEPGSPSAKVMRAASSRWTLLQTAEPVPGEYVEIYIRR